MRAFGRVGNESGCGLRREGSTPLGPGRIPLSPRATTSDKGAKTPATPPSSNSRYMGSPIRQPLRNECSTLPSNTPKTRAGKRAAVTSGARVRGSGGGSGRKRVRARGRGLRNASLQTQVEEKLADADFDAQQTQARTEALLRKAKQNVEDDAEAERKAVLAEPASGLGPQTRRGKRRESAVGSTGRTTRKKACGKMECGWVPTAAGHQCKRCSDGVVHWAGDRLCAACHRPADQNGFTHLQDTRIALARALLGNLQRDEAGVADMLRTYHPDPGQCLCRRDGCLVSRLSRHEKDNTAPRCQGPGNNEPCPAGGGKKGKRRWYSLSVSEGRGGTGASTGGTGVVCQVCYSRRNRVGRKKSFPARAPGEGGSDAAESSTSSQAPADRGADIVGAGPQRQGTGRGASTDEGSGIATPRAQVRKVKAASNVRSRAEASIKRGEIVYWKDVAEWLTAERAKLGEDELQGGSAREKVKQMFESIGRSSGCNARLVDIRGDEVAGGDRREKTLCLFPKDLRDEVVVGYLLRMRKAEGATLKSELERVAKDPTDPPGTVFEEERMAVVKTAGEIVRRDIELKQSLHNAPGLGKPNNYLKELERPVERTAVTLLGMPGTVLGLFQSVIDEELNVEQNPVESPKEKGPCKVWERGWREEFEKSAGDDTVVEGSPLGSSGAMRGTTVGSELCQDWFTRVEAIRGGCTLRSPH